MKGMLKRALAGVAATALTVAGLVGLAGTANAAQVDSADIVLTSDRTLESNRSFSAYRIGEYTDVQATGSGDSRVVTGLGVKAVSGWDTTSDSKLDAAITAASNQLTDLDPTLWNEYANSEYANDPASFIASLDTTADGAKRRAIAGALADQTDDMPAVSGKVNGTTVTFSTTSAPGLYLVVDSLGAPILIGTPVPDPANAGKFIDKMQDSDNTLGRANLKPYSGPTPTKDVKNEKPIISFNGNSVSVGDVLTYTVTVTVPNTTGYEGGQSDAYKLYIKDVADPGLTVTGISSVTLNGDILTEDTDYTVNGPDVSTTDGTTTTVVMLNDVAGKDGQQVEVTYSATVNDKAIADANGVTNTATVSQDNTNWGTPDTVTVYTYGFEFAKTNKDKSKNLKDAKFVVKYDGKFLVQDATTKAWSLVGNQAEAHTFVSDENGVVSVQGLPAGTYTVVETEAPTGYMTPADLSFDVTITADPRNPAQWTVSANENSGYVTNAKYDVDKNAQTTEDVVDFSVYNAANVGELPFTGAAGTMLFTVLGVLIAGAGVTVYMKSRSVKHALRG